MAAPSRWSRWSRWSCPSEDTLYRYSTGDASRWQRARLQRHLGHCAACAARLDEWEAVTAAYREYVNGPPAADAVEHVNVARFSARLRREPSRPPSSLVWPRQAFRLPLGWRPIAAALVIIAGGLFGFLPLQETITADALVARAVANDRQCPCPRADMVTIDASPHHNFAAQAVSTTVSTAVSTATPTRGLMSERGAHARELAERLREYAFDWQAPLSARPYQEWRAALAERTESYDWIAGDRVRVSTHVTSGPIKRAELILRTTDYRPVGQTWLFSDGFAVELRLFERAAPPVPPVLNRIAGASQAPAATVDRTVEETEIALRVSLERAGVVLTRRLTLRNSGERLTIAGRSSSRDMSRIAASAREVGDISVDVRTEARHAAIPSGALSASTGFDAWLDRTFGSSRARAAFVPTARQLCDEFADAVAALDGLSRRFSTSAADGRLSSRGRDDVRWLTSVYYTRVTTSYERLEAHLAPLTGSVSRRVLSPTPPSQWRATSAAIAPALRALAAELTSLGSSSATSSGATPSAASSDAALSNSALATADGFERTASASLRERLVAAVPR
jgi:anti-sigma factor RsiW